MTRSDGVVYERQPGSRALWQRSTVAVCAAALLLLLALSVMVPRSSDPAAGLVIDFGAASKAPSAEHPLGTDAQGRDLAARLGEAMRRSMAMGAVAAIVWGGICMVLAYVAGLALRRLRGTLATSATWVLWATTCMLLGAFLWRAVIDSSGGLFQSGVDTPGWMSPFMFLRPSAILFVVAGLAAGVWLARRVVRRAPLLSGRLLAHVTSWLLVLFVLALAVDASLELVGLGYGEASAPTLGSELAAMGSEPADASAAMLALVAVSALVTICAAGIAAAWSERRAWWPAAGDAWLRTATVLSLAALVAVFALPHVVAFSPAAGSWVVGGSAALGAAAAVVALVVAVRTRNGRWHAWQALLPMLVGVAVIAPYPLDRLLALTV